MPRKKDDTVITTKKQYYAKVAPRQIQKKKCGEKATNSTLKEKNIQEYHKECQRANDSDYAFFQPETCEKGELKKGFCKVVIEAKPGVFNAIKAPKAIQYKNVSTVNRPTEKRVLSEAEDTNIEKWFKTTINLLKRRRKVDENGDFPGFECDGRKIKPISKRILKKLDQSCVEKTNTPSIYLPAICKDGKLTKSQCNGVKRFRIDF